MRKTFLRWLFFFILTAFIITLSISFYIQTRNAHQMAEHIIQIKVEDASRMMKVANENLKEIDARIKNNALTKARTFSRLVELEPAMLKDRKKYEAVRKLLDVDELHISNEKGVLICSIPRRYEGYDMHWAKQSAEFLPILTNPKFELAQDIQGKGINRTEKFQYVGVARRDSSGLVQIGYKPDRLTNALKWIDLQEVADSFRIGKTGFLLIYNDKKLINGLARLHLGVNVEKIPVNRSFFLTINKTPYFGYAKKIDNFLYVGFMAKDEIFTSRTNFTYILTITYFLLFGLIFLLVSSLLQKVVISGIAKINKSLEKITNGDLNESVQADNSEEFTALSKGINSTVTALKAANQEMSARIDSELQLAKMIQSASLPKEMPPFPDYSEFSIFAETESARTIGGDFYDYFLLDDNHLIFFIADVSDKGIPAALLMMKSKTLFENIASSCSDVNEILSLLNNQLCRKNDTFMFVSAFLAILEISTGTLVCASAGHKPPAFKRENTPFEYWHIPSGMVLGVMPDQDYVATTFHLKPGDQIILYTDGVVDSINNDSNPFGKDRLLEALNGPILQDLDVCQFPRVFSNILNRFTNGKEQADDATVLNFIYHGDAELYEPKAEKN